MKARVAAILQCDFDLLSGKDDVAEVCNEEASGHLVMCIGNVREGMPVITVTKDGTSRAYQETPVYQPLQVGVSTPGWAVLSKGETTYVLCPKHVLIGRARLG